MAAGAAVWASVEAPAALRGMVLVGPFVHGEGSRLVKLVMGALFARPWGPAFWQRYYIRLYPTHKPDDLAAYAARLRLNLAEPGRMEALQAMLAAPKTASGSRLPQVATPALVLMGSKDPDFRDPAGEANWVAQAVRGECQMIPGAGHYPHAEFPDETAARVLPFLKSLEQTYAAKITG
jgi:pimeloyl-ACP methyl ester carboxylesterase